MNSLAMDLRVVELAMKHERAYEKHHRHLTLAASVGGVFASVSRRVASWAAAKMLDNNAQWFLDQAVWFHGAAQAVDREERTCERDPDFHLINRLRRMEGRLLELREIVLSSARRDRGEAAPAVRRFASAAAQLQEAVVELRGALQAYEADRSATVIASSAGTADELAQALKALNSEA